MSGKKIFWLFIVSILISIHNQIKIVGICIFSLVTLHVHVSIKHRTTTPLLNISGSAPDIILYVFCLLSQDNIYNWGGVFTVTISKVLSTCTCDLHVYIQCIVLHDLYTGIILHVLLYYMYYILVLYYNQYYITCTIYWYYITASIILHVLYIGIIIMIILHVLLLYTSFGEKHN